MTNLLLGKDVSTVLLDNDEMEENTYVCERYKQPVKMTWDAAAEYARGKKHVYLYYLGDTQDPWCQIPNYSRAGDNWIILDPNVVPKEIRLQLALIK